MKEIFIGCRSVNNFFYILKKWEIKIFPIGRNGETKLPKKRNAICCQRL